MVLSIPTGNHSSRLGERERLVVLHTAEGATTAQALGAFFQRVDNASSHVGIDDHTIAQYVPYDRAAWTLRNGNQESDNAEMCGFASWSRDEWMRHDGMLRQAAQWIRARCKARGVPIRRLSIAEVAEAMRNDNHPGGVCDHDAYTKATGDGTHWDIGSNFPWDYVMRLATGEEAPEQEDDFPMWSKWPRAEKDAFLRDVSTAGWNHNVRNFFMSSKRGKKVPEAAWVALGTMEMRVRAIMAGERKAIIAAVTEQRRVSDDEVTKFIDAELHKVEQQLAQLGDDLRPGDESQAAV